MISKLKFIIYFTFTFGVMILSCTTVNLRFKDAEPVRYLSDIQPIPAPKSVRYDKFDYYATVLPSRPIIEPAKISSRKNSLDINSMDEVPASSWFIPRLGYENISPAQLLKGPFEYGPPVPPITIIRIRQINKNPRLFIYDSRMIFYLLKFDPISFPYIATCSSFIVNRLFWGFGYNVPEDHIFTFTRDQLKIDPQSKITADQVQKIFDQNIPLIEGKYRAIASRILEGLPLGPTPDKGVRADDPNDFFPHQDRRVLRGLRVFAAFINMCDINSDNTLDMYVGDDGEGYIKHYMIDFDDAFGTHAARYQRLWAGYNHLFSIHDIFKNLYTLGFWVQDWEKINVSHWKSVGFFESTVFQPETWKETYHYQPIRESRPSDDYWAAKIIGALSNEHIKILVKAAGYPSEKIDEYMITILVERKRKILKYFLAEVTPLEFERVDDDTLYLKDMEYTLRKDSGEASYSYQFRTVDGKNLSKEKKINVKSEIVKILLSHVQKIKHVDYVRIDIQKIRNDNSKAPVTQFHLLRNKKWGFKLAGIVH